MGRKSTITDELANQLLAAAKAGSSQRQIARDFGLSVSTVQRFFESLPTATAPTLVQHAAVVERAGSSLWDSRAALSDNYQRALDLVSKLDAGIVEADGEYTSRTPIAVHVAALREVREHIKTSLAILKLLVDVDEVRRFQQAVLTAIGEADESTKQRILAILQARHALEFPVFRS